MRMPAAERRAEARKAATSARIAVLKEMVRQQELRLTAQTQAKQALQARTANSVGWLLALLSVLLALVFSSRWEEVRLAPVGWAFVAVLVITALLALTFTLIAPFTMLRWRRLRLSWAWHYPGSEPDLPPQRMEVKREEDILQATVDRYSEAIRENARLLDRLRSASLSSVGFLVFGTLVGCILIAVLVETAPPEARKAAIGLPTRPGSRSEGVLPTREGAPAAGQEALPP